MMRLHGDLCEILLNFAIRIIASGICLAGDKRRFPFYRPIKAQNGGQSRLVGYRRLAERGEKKRQASKEGVVDELSRPDRSR